MQITNSYIIDQPKLATPGTSTTALDRLTKQHKVEQAKDSYRKNSASAPIIDAEYIDFHNPDTKAFRQERNNLHQTLEPDKVSLEQKAETIQRTNSLISKYQTAPADLPRPGTYINTFA